MIRRYVNGQHYCDGKDCGSQIVYVPSNPEEDEPGLIVCPDCNSSMYWDVPARNAQADNALTAGSMAEVS